MDLSFAHFFGQMSGNPLLSMAVVLTILSWREIFDKLEACADACERVGDCIETIVMKNT